jgi:hypothetical protein
MKTYIKDLITALLAAIAKLKNKTKHETQQIEKDNKLKIKGLDVSFEELVESGNAQIKLIKLNKAIVDKIDELEKRIKTSEDDIRELERDIDKHLG